MELNRSTGRSFWLIWGLSFFITFLIVALATLPPFLSLPWRAVIMDMFAPVCHQLPDRSPYVSSVQLAVCHRCYGVYLGLPLAAVATLLLQSLSVSKKALRFGLMASLGLLAIDWGAPLLGLWHNTPATRLVTGLIFGIIAGWYLVHALMELRGA